MRKSYLCCLLVILFCAHGYTKEKYNIEQECKKLGMFLDSLFDNKEIIIKKNGKIFNLKNAYFSGINSNRIMISHDNKIECVSLFNLHPKYRDLFLINDFKLSNGQIIKCGQIRFILEDVVYIKCRFEHDLSLYYRKVNKNLLTGDFKKYFCK